MKKRLPFRLMAAAGAAASLVGVGAVISASSGAAREYRAAVGPVPASLQQPAAPGATAAATTGGASSASVSRTPPTGSAAQDAQDYSRVSFVVGKLLARQHFLHHPLDTEVSRRLFERYLDALDPQRAYFTQEDIAEWLPLRDKLAQRIDSDGDTRFANVAYDRFRERFEQRLAFVNDALKTRPFEFTGDDTYLLDRRKAERPKDVAAARELWWQQLRAEYLQEKLAGKADDKTGEKTAAEKTPEKIKEAIGKRYARVARNLKEQGTDEVFEIYVDMLCRAFDPHSDYFGKASTEQFNIDMKLSLYGIGASLQQSDEGFVKIMQLMAGGPAIKSKKLKVGDQITAVGQAEGEMVDVQDMNTNKVVQMIRGPKGTPVRLSILPAGATDPSTRTQITLVRDEIRLEEQAAKAQVIDLPMPAGPTGKASTMRLGVIDLPSFYGGDGPRSSSEDVRRLLEKLKQEKVQGIVLDLRRNGGGSLPEAISLTGLFIPRGPVVQQIDAAGRREVGRDNDASVVWDGPMAVLTSKGSASASEIIAGALQDYGRAVILGDGQTFGKGTVQEVRDLNPVMRLVNLETVGDPGSIHLTTQKFYRPGGASTQLKGVSSDIVIPSATSVLDIGERVLEYPLPFDTIKPAEFSRANRVAPFLADLKKRSAQRVASNRLFAFLREDIARYQKAQKDKALSLNEAKRRKEKAEAEARDAQRKKAIAAINAASGEKVYPVTLADVNKPGLPPALKPKQANAKNSQSGPEADAAALTADDAGESGTGAAGLDRDITLDEAKRVLADYVTLVRK